jgi:uncharacterized protein
MTAAGVSKPVPVADEVSEEFWKAAANHVLAIQRCDECGWFSYPPSLTCRGCRLPGRSFHYEQVSGRGRVKTWTVVREAFLPSWKDEIPYPVAVVELDEQEGLYLTARIVGARPGDMAIGAPVEVVFEDLAEGISVPHFRLAGKRMGR